METGLPGRLPGGEGISWWLDTKWTAEGGGEGAQERATRAHPWMKDKTGAICLLMTQYQEVKTQLRSGGKAWGRHQAGGVARESQSP